MNSLVLLPVVAVALAASRFPAPPVTTAGEIYAIVAVHSSVTFRVLHANATNFYGVFKQPNGEFTVDAAKPEDNKVAVKIATESIDSRDDKRDQHLRSPDFFDAKQFPDISFTSSK